MSVAATTSYVANNLYYRINASTTETQTASGESADQTTETSSASGDRVTFSKDLTAAQTREAMGLNPTGKLRLKDLEEVAQDREAAVSTTLAQTMQSLGIELDEEISLSVDSNGDIQISGDFPEKSDLEDALNEDEEFTTAFSQLSANQSILDHISQLQNSAQNFQASIVDYFGSDSDPDSDISDLLSLADEIETIKSGDNRMGTLLNLSTSQTPFFYTYNPNGEVE
jgi:hypothetical protein